MSSAPNSGSTPGAAVQSGVPSLKPRVLIADNSQIKFQQVIASLQESNVEVRFTNDHNAVTKLATEFVPDLILINLFMATSSTLGVIRDAKKLLEKQGSKILVLTTHYSRENITESVKAGASDFILDPFDPRLLIQRIRYQLQDRQFIAPDDLRAEPTQVSAGFQMVYDSLRVLAEVKEGHRALYEVIKRVAELSQSTRVNVLIGDLEANTGTIAAASDDPQIDGKTIDLERYPEVREVLLNGSIICIKDITQNPLTRDIKNQVKSIDITSLLVFPIRHRQETIGTLNIRLGASGLDVSDKHLKTFYMIALALGPKLAGRKLLKKLQT